jgi:hypothetical protein
VLNIQTAGTTAIAIDASQAVTFAGAVSLSGNQTTTGNLTVNGNTTLGDASTDTILMTGAPSIGGAGLGMGMGFRNRIINGAMVIDQRNAGASVTPNNSYTLDRWLYENVQTGKVTIQQNAGAVTPPTGFTNYLGVTSTSAYSVLSGDTFLITTRIEGYNMADFAFGTASASYITLSFWVRSSLTGTFGGSFGNVNATRCFAFSYTINAANTWEQKTVTIAGDTSGTWNTTTGRGLSIAFGLGSGSTYTGTAGSWQAANLVQPTGSVSLVGTNGATFYITGVQLEKGATATSFDYRDYGRELILCQRYFQKYSGQPSAYLGNGNLGRNGYLTSFIYPVKMRTAPTASNITGFAAGNATTYAFSSPSIATTVDGLSEMFGASATALNYSEPFCAFFTTLDLSAEL